MSGPSSIASLHNNQPQYHQQPQQQHNAAISMDREFRYMLQWFAEWSEIQREDFVPVLLECLADKSTTAGSSLLQHVNGDVLANQLADVSLANVAKPMSLFQCRVKLFREWSAKWPADLKQTLRDKCQLIDADWSERFAGELGVDETPIATIGHADESVSSGDVADESSASASLSLSPPPDAVEVNVDDGPAEVLAIEETKSDENEQVSTGAAPECAAQEEHTD